MAAISLFDFGPWTAPRKRSGLDFRLKREPRLQILLKALLRFESVGDNDERAVRKKLMEQSCEEWLRARADAGESQRFSLLQSPCQRLHGGSVSDAGKDVACRRMLRFARQAYVVCRRLAGRQGRGSPGSSVSKHRDCVDVIQSSACSKSGAVREGLDPHLTPALPL
jgi:hypothetical protein